MSSPNVAAAASPAKETPETDRARRGGRRSRDRRDRHQPRLRGGAAVSCRRPRCLGERCPQGRGRSMALSPPAQARALLPSRDSVSHIGCLPSALLVCLFEDTGVATVTSRKVFEQCCVHLRGRPVAETRRRFTTARRGHHTGLLSAKYDQTEPPHSQSASGHDDTHPIFRNGSRA
jgi:hypothetical protein